MLMGSKVSVLLISLMNYWAPQKDEKDDNTSINVRKVDFGLISNNDRPEYTALLTLF